MQVSISVSVVVSAACISQRNSPINRHDQVYTNSFLATLNARSTFKNPFDETELKPYSVTPQGTTTSKTKSINIRIETAQESIRDKEQTLVSGPARIENQISGHILFRLIQSLCRRRVVVSTAMTFYFGRVISTFKGLKFPMSNPVVLVFLFVCIEYVLSILCYVLDCLTTAP